jgi:CRISPR system Cascade subunit CasD
MIRCLLLVLEGPMLSFGVEMVDARGPIGDFPATSLLTGLLGNALGWRRSDTDRLGALQQRLHFAARIDREGVNFTDFQTAQLAKNDRGWTTRGSPEGRDGGPGTYLAPHLRWRDYAADKRITVALTLDRQDESPTLDELAAALHRPARPLFLGRKSCLPSRPIFEGFAEAAELLDALPPSATPARVLLPDGEAGMTRDERLTVTDMRDWQSGVHGGQRSVIIRQTPGAVA